MNSVIDPSGAPAEAPPPESRAAAGIYPPESETRREPRMLEAWAEFGRDMGERVRAALDRGRSPPEIAYAVGEIVHNYFRTRGLTLTSYELRKLVALLLSPAPPPAGKPEAEAQGLVSFAGKPARPPSTTLFEEQPALPPPAAAVLEAALAPPPSKLVNVIGRDVAPFDRLLARVVDEVRPRIDSAPRAHSAREEVFKEIDATIDRVLQEEEATLPPEQRERLAQFALSEVLGLGPIDRLWADRSVRAVFVDGPRRVYVERADGTHEPAVESFRDLAHLSAIAERLAGAVRASAPGVMEFQLRDGGAGLAIFPPAAPEGPVLVVRRGEPGQATFERLVKAEMFDRRIAALLRLAARTRLNILVAGPEGSGKTSLLAAIARDQNDLRVVTLSRHREFRWPSLAKVELVALPQANAPSYGALLAAATRLRPDLLLSDSVRIEDVPALAERLSRNRGTIAAIALDALASALAGAADLVVRLGRPSGGLYRVISLEDGAGTPILVHEAGRYRRVSSEPAFAQFVRQAGYGEALDRLLH